MPDYSHHFSESVRKFFVQIFNFRYAKMEYRQGFETIFARKFLLTKGYKNY